MLRIGLHVTTTKNIKNTPIPNGTAGEIADLLDLAPASASEHLKVLRKHELVDLTINGTFRIYQTRRQAILRLRRLLDNVFPMEEP